MNRSRWILSTLAVAVIATSVLFVAAAGPKEGAVAEGPDRLKKLEDACDKLAKENRDLAGHLLKARKDLDATMESLKETRKSLDAVTDRVGKAEEQLQDHERRIVVQEKQFRIKAWTIRPPARKGGELVTHTFSVPKKTVAVSASVGEPFFGLAHPITRTVALDRKKDECRVSYDPAWTNPGGPIFVDINVIAVYEP